MPNYEALMQQDVKALAQQVAFYPSDQAQGFAYSTGSNLTDMTGTFAGFKHSVVNNDKIIARVKLEIKQAGDGRGEVLAVMPSLTSNTGVPVYFLPWDARGAAVTLTIPNANPALPEDQHPKIFFTAALSGCMIAFKGTPQNPTIYHCGTAGGGAGTNTGGANSNKFFKDLLAQAEQSGISPAAGGLVSKIKSTDYMVVNSGAGRTDISPSVTNAFTQNFANRVLKYVGGWGACFGVRTGRDWKFYHQQNVSIQYTKVESVIKQKTVTKKKMVFFNSTKIVNYQGFQEAFLSVCKPIEVVRVFPGRGTIKQVDIVSLLR